jgi:hypothetical protein
MMKKAYILMAVCLLSFTGISMAGFGNGAMDCTGPIGATLEGDPMTISGVVVSTGSGQGVTIDNGTELVIVGGFGPVWYWEANEVSKPQNGEEITVEGYMLTLSDGSTRIIAFTVTVSGDTLELRDPETGKPLWRGKRGQQRSFQQGGNS